MKRSDRSLFSLLSQRQQSLLQRRALIQESLKKKKPEQSDRDIAELILQRYPGIHGGSLDSFRRIVTDERRAMGNLTTTITTKKKAKETIAMELIAQYPEDSITSLANKLSTYPECAKLSHIRLSRIISECRKFKRLL